VVAIRFFNQKKSFLRTNSVDMPSLLEKEAGEIPDDYDILDEMSKVELYEAIEKLPKTRERFALLGVLAGKSAGMIAKELGCTVTAVYNLTKKARMALKKRMKGKGK
jgi:DNA-directed RNA polymerase specialized sigma24 family protein